MTFDQRLRISLLVLRLSVFLVMFIFGGVLENSGNVVLFMGGFHWQSLAYECGNQSC